MAVSSTVSSKFITLCTMCHNSCLYLMTSPNNCLYQQLVKRLILNNLLIVYNTLFDICNNVGFHNDNDNDIGLFVISLSNIKSMIDLNIICTRS